MYVHKLDWLRCEEEALVLSLQLAFMCSNVCTYIPVYCISDTALTLPLPVLPHTTGPLHELLHDEQQSLQSPQHSQRPHSLLIQLITQHSHGYVICMCVCTYVHMYVHTYMCVDRKYAHIRSGRRICLLTVVVAILPSEGTALLSGSEGQPQLEGSLYYEPSVLEVDVQGKAVGVWVSCVEIYNEFIYDLFAEIPTTKRVTRQKGKGSQPQRHALRLAEDKNHNVFIKGELLTESSRVIAWAYANVFSGSFGVLCTYIRMCLCINSVHVCVLWGLMLPLREWSTAAGFHQ